MQPTVGRRVKHEGKPATVYEVLGHKVVLETEQGVLTQPLDWDIATQMCMIEIAWLTVAEFDAGPRQHGWYWVKCSRGWQCGFYAHGRQEWQLVGVAGWQTAAQHTITAIGDFLGEGPK